MSELFASDGQSTWACIREENRLELNEVKWSCSVMSDPVTPWTVAHQAPLSMEFFRQEYWSGLPFPSPGDLPDPGVELGSPALQADALPSEPPKGLGEQGQGCVCGGRWAAAVLFWVGRLAWLSGDIWEETWRRWGPEPCGYLVLGEVHPGQRKQPVQRSCGQQLPSLSKRQQGGQHGRSEVSAGEQREKGPGRRESGWQGLARVLRALRAWLFSKEDGESHRVMGRGSVWMLWWEYSRGPGRSGGIGCGQEMKMSGLGWVSLRGVVGLSGAPPQALNTSKGTSGPLGAGIQKGVSKMGSTNTHTHTHTHTFEWSSRKAEMILFYSRTHSRAHSTCSKTCLWNDGHSKWKARPVFKTTWASKDIWWPWVLPPWWGCGLFSHGLGSSWPITQKQQSWSPLRFWCA